MLYLGGGGDIDVSMKFDNVFLSQLISNENILYIPVACDFTSYENCLKWFKSLLKKHHKKLNVNMIIENDIIPNFEKYSAIYIGGGNTYKLLDYIIKNNLNIKFEDYIKNGGLVFGGSAGAIIFGKTIETVIEEKEDYSDNEALGFVDNYAIRCHYSKKDEQYFLDTSKRINFKLLAIPEDSGVIINQSKKIEKIIGKVYIFENGIKKL